jgi:hypothetical protein
MGTLEFAVWDGFGAHEMATSWRHAHGAIVEVLATLWQGGHPGVYLTGVVGGSGALLMENRPWPG